MPRIIRPSSGTDWVPVASVVPLIVEVRTKLRLTQTQLAETLGYATVSVQRWEQGQAQGVRTEVVARLRQMLRDATASDARKNAVPPVVKGS